MKTPNAGEPVPILGLINDEFKKGPQFVMALVAIYDEMSQQGLKPELIDRARNFCTIISHTADQIKGWAQELEGKLPPPPPAT
jgi:hypothetical protein